MELSKVCPAAGIYAIRCWRSKQGTEKTATFAWACGLESLQFSKRQTSSIFLQRRFSMQINAKNIFGTLVCLQPFSLKGFYKVSWQRWCLPLGLICCRRLVDIALSSAQDGRVVGMQFSQCRTLLLENNQSVKRGKLNTIENPGQLCNERLLFKFRIVSTKS